MKFRAGDAKKYTAARSVCVCEREQRAQEKIIWDAPRAAALFLFARENSASMWSVRRALHLMVVYFIIICEAKFKRQNVTCTIFALLIFKARVEELKETA